MRPLLVFVLLASPVLADGIPISGRITDAAGNPVPGVEFGAEWSNRNGKLLPFQRLKPGADGNYSGELHWRAGHMTFFALDAQQQNGALLVVEEKDLKAPMTVNLKLGPLTGVTGALACPTVGPALGTTSVIIVAQPSGAWVAKLTQNDDKFVMPLPPGNYEVRAFAKDAGEFRKAFQVEAGGKPLDLGKLELEPSAIAKCWGKAPPAFAATAARGAPAGVNLAGFKGKWVLLVMWNTKDDDTATREIFPRLGGLIERQKDRAGKFEVLALHDPTVKNRNEYDARIAPLKAGLWAGKDPPFPVLLDSTGETWKAWGMDKETAMVLIDPEGNVVKAGDDRMLEEKLEGR